MISEILKKMILYSNGNLHDINHFIKVWTYAKTIAELEGVDESTKYILETAAIVHDIACPVLRARSGSCDGKMQEIEGPDLAKEFLKEFEFSEEQLSRVLYLVGHHHTCEDVNGIDYQILLEADYIVNAGESGYSLESIKETDAALFRTVSGKSILESIFGF